MLGAQTNAWQDVDGHAFDVDNNMWLLLEGNYFENVKTPLTEASYTNGGQIFFIQTDGDAQTAAGALGYTPVVNYLTGSGEVSGIVSQEAADTLGEYKDSISWEHWAVEDVPANVQAIAGVGK